MFYIIRFRPVSKCNLPFLFNDREAGAFHKAGDLSLLGQRTLRALESAYEQFGKGILVPSTSEQQGSTRRSPGCFESSNKLDSSQRICQSPPGTGDTKTSLEQHLLSTNLHFSRRRQMHEEECH